MRVTICELPYEKPALDDAWRALCAHTTAAHSELVVLPEVAFSGPLWLDEHFDPNAWRKAELAHERWLPRLPELGASFAIGTRPLRAGSERFNEGFLWSAESGLVRLRRKYFLPDEPEGWEARWFMRGDAAFPCYAAGALSFGLNICTELWALDTYRAYAASSAQAVIAPRATAAATTDKWLSVATVAAVASGAYCLSSNRVHADGSCGGVGFAIDPDGALLARTSRDAPHCTVDLDLARPRTARDTYPRYVFARA